MKLERAHLKVLQFPGLLCSVHLEVRSAAVKINFTGVSQGLRGGVPGQGEKASEGVSQEGWEASEKGPRPRALGQTRRAQGT